MKLQRSSPVPLLAAVLMFAAALPAWALEYRSTSRAALLYDAPTATAEKIAVAGSGLPLEVVVDAGAWVKVRDHNGSLNWVEASALGTPRTVMIKADASAIRKQPRSDADVVFRGARGLLLELKGNAETQGWLQVRHASGLSGWMPVHEAWGR